MIGWCRECRTNPVEYTHYRGVPFGPWCRSCAKGWAASGKPVPSFDDRQRHCLPE